MPRPHARIARVGALALATLVAATTAATASAAPHRPDRAKLQHALDAVVSSGAPGAIALVRDGRRTVRLVSGYENLATRRPMRPRDRFRVGSVDEDVRRHRRAAARRRGQARARRHRRALAARARARWRASPSASCSTTPAASPTTPDGRHVRPARPRRPAPDLDAARAGRHRDGQPPLFAPGAGAGVLEHRLHPARPDRRGGERTPARRPSCAGGSSRRCASAPRASTPGRASPDATHTATRAITARSAARHQRDRPVLRVGRRRDRLDRGRPRPLLPRPARRAPAASRPARRDAHDRARRLRPGVGPRAHRDSVTTAGPSGATAARRSATKPTRTPAGTARARPWSPSTPTRACSRRGAPRCASSTGCRSSPTAADTARNESAPRVRPGASCETGARPHVTRRAIARPECERASPGPSRARFGRRPIVRRPAIGPTPLLHPRKMA